MKRNEKQGVLFEIEPRQEDKHKREKDKKKPLCRCTVCGKGLSDPRSIAAGYGPVCMHNHYADGQKDYAENLFMLNEDQRSRRIASFTIENIGKNAVLITDLDDDEDKPSVTNSIDEILSRLEIDKHKVKVICLGTDKMYSHYNGTWKFAGWSKEEAISSLNIRRKE